MTGLTTSVHFLALTRSILHELAEVAEKGDKSGMRDLIQKMKNAENLLASIASQLQKLDPSPNLSGTPEKVTQLLSEHRELNPLAFRGVKLISPLLPVGRPDIKVVELSDDDYLNLNTR